jgi:hypothetical protein
VNAFDASVLGLDAEPAAAALALERARRGGCALVLSDAAAPAFPLALPAAAAARRLARRLAREDATAVARGRLVYAWPEGELLAVARRCAACCDGPVVLALGSPRDELIDLLLLESREVVVVADPEGPLAALALADLAELGIGAAVAGARPPRPLARLGWREPRWLRLSGPLPAGRA